jgi:virginiamycin B lyase
VNRTGDGTHHQGLNPPQRDLTERKGRSVLQAISAGNRTRRSRLRRLSVIVTAVGAASLLAAGSGAAVASDAPTHTARGYIYWTNGHWIGRATLNGTDVNQKFITGAAYGTGMTVSGGYVYWANIGAIPVAKHRGTIARARLNGTDVNEKFITGASLPVGVTVARGYLYWANNLTGWIGRARLNGTDVDQKFIKTAQAEGPDGVVAGGGYIYWANDYGIGRARINGAHVNQDFVSVPDGPSGVSGLAVNSRFLYWTDETAGTIGRACLNGTHVNQKFITGGNFPEAGLTLDSRYLYWANAGNGTTGTIGRARLNGTDVNQHFISTRPSTNMIGLFGAAVAPGRHWRG